MRFRNQKRKYMMPRFNMHAITINHGEGGGGNGGGEGGGGGGNGSGGNNGNTGANNDAGRGNNNQGGSNNDDNLDAFGSMWDTNLEEGDGNSNNTQNNNNNNGNNNGHDFETTWSNHVKELNLTNGVDARSVMQAIEQGDPNALQAAFEKIAANSYRASMLSSNKLVQNAVQKAVADATNNATGAIRADNALSKLHERLPFTKHAATAPIAKAVLAEAMRTHKGDAAKAVETAENYFRAFAKQAGRDLRINVPPASRNGNNRGGGSSQDYNSSDDGGDSMDWLQILGAPQ